jgi:peptide/nickel transport system substrate-binding protein
MGVQNTPRVVSAVLVLALAAFGCGGGDDEQPEAGESVAAEETDEQANEAPAPASADDVLKVSATATVTTWDPIASFSTEALYLANVYEQLLRVNPPDADEPYTPLLAESWETADDGMSWTFNLRDGVSFHDGEPLTADAVKGSIEAAQERAGASFIWAPLESIEVVDELTVRFELSYPAPVDLIASSLYGAWIVSPNALAEEEGYFEQGVAAGTGPYVLDSYAPDQEVLLTAYEDYWGETPEYETVLVTIVEEAVQQQQMLEGGEVDLALRLPQSSYADFKDREGYTVVEEPSFFNYLGFFNTTRAPLDDPRVRQALSYAIPYDDVIDIGTYGYGTQSRGPVPAGVFPYSDEVPRYEQDLDRARELLAEAGVEEGLELRMTYAAENETHARYAPLLRDAFADVGVDLEVEPILWGQQWEEAKGDPASAQDIFLLLYWPTYSDAGSDNLYSLFRSSEAPFFNLSYWANAQYDELIDEAVTLTGTDRDEAAERYEEAMTLLVDEAAGFFLFDTTGVYVVPDHLSGFRYNLNYPFATFFAELRPS